MARSRDVQKICITGGPCAGKTTALSTINSYLSSRGFKVYIVPEAATLLMKSGFSIEAQSFTELDAIHFQAHLMRTQITLEDIFMSYAYASLKKPTIVFTDRGLMDGKAYCSNEVWQGVLDEIGKSEMAC